MPEPTEEFLQISVWQVIHLDRTVDRVETYADASTDEAAMELVRERCAELGFDADDALEDGPVTGRDGARYDLRVEMVDLAHTWMVWERWNAMMHPEVRCGATDGCGEIYTACDAGNHYCPSCGESCEGAEPVHEHAG